MDNLRLQKFKDISIDDKFFGSLKESYKEFSDWFHRKAEDSALVLYNEQNEIEGFLFCKFECGPGDDTTPLLPDSNHMKVGTFKFNPQGTRRGDRYLKKIFDYALAHSSNVQDIYVTVFEEKHGYLVNLFNRYGFEHYGTKPSKNGVEQVLLRDLNKTHNDVDKDYPFIHCKDSRKYLLGIYPEHHTKLFPDSRLFTESPNIVKDISHSNSIHKIYICQMRAVMELQRGDVIVIYRTGDGRGAAEYRAVATSLCVVEGVHTIDTYENEEHFVSECVKFSVFSEKELRQIYRERRYNYVINFTYNVALPKRPIRKTLADQVGLNRDDRWGFLELSDQQFQELIRVAEVDPKFIRA
ncbi:N-acetyltransferase [Photobacterium damselae]|uniref:N-acetyltransferase n=1 Tax=Photobacterium damselae TaxID=38293 RepID=UPI0010FD55F9|nr:N-acetyltransferase [Photobacterium damselae]TLS78837.1 N-acetyltransferase [Photobacterium damselae subsp. damselae]TLS86925.1 N-acetyltransferase [Photobacterium damselae subsp. damselae]UKA06107.1 N-acetyltransferase [Photobacterium damselae subsp. damselae]UKA21211.1 N-acetyltransferase [Photobacterium damselae subsp. damselae]